ncbi:MAG: HNH endonuclease signature motif containing protein [Hoeflea sp.]|nr:HNH endonuclease signature motif containing protein [Hoeflea sp.]
MKLLIGPNRTLDANFTVQPVGGGFEIDWESRGGSDPETAISRNKEYGPAFETLLERMAQCRMHIEQIEISSTRAIDAGKDRRINPNGFDYPINLNGVNFGQLRISIGRELAGYGRVGIDKKGGNSTKRMTLRISWPSNPTATAAEIEDALMATYGGPRGDIERSLKYGPLGTYLRTRLHEDEVVLSFAEIEGFVGHLPQSARSSQFWANTRDHHVSRRSQWLDNGFSAYYDASLPGVRFVRPNAAEAPTYDEEELERRAKRAEEHFKKSGKSTPPPSGNEDPDRSPQVRTAFERDPRVVAWVRSQADGVCESCRQEAPFEKDDGTPYLEVHHLRPLAEGGPDTVENAIACCPNCHRRLHQGRGRLNLREDLIRQIPRLLDYPARLP